MRSALRKMWRPHAIALGAMLLVVSVGSGSGRAADVVSQDASDDYMLEIGGVQAGFLKTVEGGTAVGEVVRDATRPGYFTGKHIGIPEYEDITMQLGFSMTNVVYDWIAASWQLDFQRKNGRIYQLNASKELDFFNALVTETTIPACDRASQAPAFIEVKLVPEYTTTRKASSQVATGLRDNEQPSWLSSNFRLEVDGLDCTKVAKVDTFTVKQTSATDAIGDPSDDFNPQNVEFPNLKITLDESSAATWEAWHRDFVIEGNSVDDREKSGRLVFLAPDMQTELAVVKFFNLGIAALRPAKREASPDGIERVQAELYCERMELPYRAP